MMQLLKIEWLKTKSSKTFWILIILFALLLPLFNYRISKAMGDAGKLLSFGYEFPNVWGVFGFWASWFVLFIAFLIIILITNEYRYRTNRQNVIDGWTRVQTFHAKCGFVVLMALLTTLYVGIWCLILGAVYSDGLDGATDSIEKLGYFFILCLNYYAFAAMLAFLLKRSGLTIGLFMLYALIIENILQWQIPEIKNYLPLQSSDELLPFTAFKRLMEMANPGAITDTTSTTTLMVTSVIYIAIYYTITRWRLSKTDW